MKQKLHIVLIILVFSLTACTVTISDNPITATSTPAVIPTSGTIPNDPVISLPTETSLPPTQPPAPVVDIPPTAVLSTNQAVMDRAFGIIQVLKNQDMVSLSGYVHPANGVRFSPYAYVQDTDQVFSAEKVASIMADSSVYTWGNYSGTGEPIILSFPEYYARFIYDVDFANAPQLSLNHRISSGNSLDNSAEFYPASMVVEFYFPGFDPQYGGMDWRSLRLALSDVAGTWYLEGIIHDEWTP